MTTKYNNLWPTTRAMVSFKPFVNGKSKVLANNIAGHSLVSKTAFLKLHYHRISVWIPNIAFPEGDITLITIFAAVRLCESGS